MVITTTKRKVIITKVSIEKLERFKPFEIRLPANARKVTGVMVTSSATWTE